MTTLSSEEIERRVEEIARRCKYEGYLQSRRWADKRRQKLVEQNYTCERCGYCRLTNPIDIPLDAHHKTYDHLGDEPLSDLEVLCRNCHTKQHGK
jgi:5-methylcytosine-specific restriction endonuclease McrA